MLKLHGMRTIGKCMLASNIEMKLMKATHCNPTKIAPAISTGKFNTTTVNCHPYPLHFMKRFLYLIVVPLPEKLIQATVSSQSFQLTSITGLFLGNKQCFLRPSLPSDKEGGSPSIEEPCQPPTLLPSRFKCMICNLVYRINK